MMKIEWDEPPRPKKNVDSLWTKVKNNISVLRQKHDVAPPPLPRSSSSSNQREGRSRTMSMYKPSSSSSRPVQRSRSVGHSAPAYAPRHASARSPPRPVPSPISTRPPVHRSMSHVQSPLRTTAPSTPTRSGSGSRTPSTPRAGGGGGYGGPGGRPVASRQSSTPVTYDRDGNPGIMCNGKLIVGDPDEVKRYVSAQESIQKWRENVR